VAAGECRDERDIELYGGDQFAVELDRKSVV